MKFKKIGVLAVAMMMVVGGFFVYNVLAVATVTPASGGDEVSILTTSDGGSGEWTSLTGPVITEGATGDIGTGSHTLTLPSGWEFDTTQNVTISVGGGTELTLAAQIITPGTTTLSFNVTVASSSGTGILTFSGIKVRPTGTTAPTTGSITHSGGTIAGVDGETNFGTLATIVGAATKLTITTQPTHTVYGSTISDVVIESQDALGNKSTGGLGSNHFVTLSLSSGTGTIDCSSSNPRTTPSRNIGTASGNGEVTFDTLKIIGTDAVGTGKAITAAASGLTNAVSNSFNITAKTLTATITVDDKEYDGNTTATIASRILVGVEDGDTVTISGGTAVFETSTIGDEKTVNATGLTLGGDHSANYSFNGEATTTADITEKELTVGGSFTVSDKTYDGGLTATIDDNSLTLVGVVEEETVTLTDVSLVFADKNVDTGIAVSIDSASLAGDDNANYTLSLTGAPTTTADITEREITITAQQDEKVYDGSTSSSGSPIITVGSLATGDTGVYSQTYDTATFGTEKTLTATVTSILDGSNADMESNYDITLLPDETGVITKKELTVVDAVVTTKVYDGNNEAAITGATLSGVVGSEDVTLENHESGTFASVNVETHSVTTVPMTLSGVDIGNYTLTQPTLTGTITVRPITVTAATDTKVYDGNVSSTGTPTVSEDSLADGDDITTITQTFDNKNVGSGKTLTPSGVVNDGNSGDNYNVTFVTDTTGIIQHAETDSFVVTPSTTTPTVGTAIDLTITAIDEFGNTADGANGATPYTGQAYIQTDGTAATVHGAIKTFTAGDEGEMTITGAITFNTAESGKSITVANSGGTIAGTETGINVAASDTTPPVITSMSLDKPAYRLTQDPNVTVVVVEDNTADDVLINGTSGTEDPAGTWTRAFAHGKATAGMYSFTVIASDSTGNENINTVWYSVIEDDDPATPVVAITSPSAGATVDGSTTIQFTTNSGATTDAYISIDGGTYVTATTNANPGTYVLDTTTLSNGSHTLRVKDTVDGVTGYSDYLTFIVNNLEEPTSVTVDRIERTETYATADGTYANGWEWVFHITVPTAETQLYMKFKDWTSGSNTIEVAENMRYYSAQSSNASAEGSAIEIAEAEEYPETAMLLNSDLDAFTGGRQIKVVVQAKVPAGTAGGSYSTSYKVLSEEVAE